MVKEKSPNAAKYETNKLRLHDETSLTEYITSYLCRDLPRHDNDLDRLQGQPVNWRCGSPLIPCTREIRRHYYQCRRHHKPSH